MRSNQCPQAMRISATGREDSFSGHSAPERPRGGKMHRLDLRTYAGSPGETVTVATNVQGSGSVTVELDGQDIGGQRQFQLKNNPGDQTEMRITLFGATGDSCTVGVSTVDGGTDGDLL